MDGKRFISFASAPRHHPDGPTNARNEWPGCDGRDSEGILRIPMKWGTDSDEVGQHQSEATLVMAMITEVPHFSQVFLLGEG
jgi:hypothetical protein